MPKARNEEAAYASNWRQVLLVDAALGAVVVVAGIVAALVLSGALGGLLIAAGLVYVLLGLQRARRWRRLRAERGL